MSKSSIVTVIALLLVVISAGALTYYISSKNNNDISEDTTKLFVGSDSGTTYIDMEGNPLTLQDYLGKVVVVTTWASWSPFTQTDFVTLQTLAANNSKEDVVFLAINRKETRDLAQRYISSLPPVSGVILVIDQEDLFYQSVGGYAMPETVVFSPTGEIVLHERGLAKLESLSSVINENIKPK